MALVVDNTGMETAGGRGQQIVEFSGIEEKLSKIEQAGEETKANLDGINRLIESSVGSGAGIWDGESASQFKSSWDALAAEIPGFIDTVENQARNVKLMLEKTKESDQNGGVNIGGTSPSAVKPGVNSASTGSNFSTIQ